MAQLSLVGMLFFLSSLKKEIIMNQIFYDAIMENPVIAAVKDEDGIPELRSVSAYVSI